MTSPIACDPTHKFDSFVDMHSMKEVFATELPGFLDKKESILHCTLMSIHYKRFLKPSSLHKSFLSVCYRLTVVDKFGSTIRHPILYGKAFIGGRSFTEWERLYTSSSSHPIHMPSKDFIVWYFPDDPALPQLPTLINVNEARQHLPYAHLPAELSEGRHLTSISRHLLHYRPECRCTIRYDLDWTIRSHPKRMMVVAKTFREGGWAVFERMRELWDYARRDPTQLHVPEPLSYDEKLRTVWQVGSKGMPLRTVWEDDHRPTAIAAVARGLAAIHRCEMSSSVTRTVEEHVQELRKKIAKLSDVFPPGLRTFRTVEDLLHDMAATQPTPALRLIHGDFHIDQLRIDREKNQIIFFDFDEFAHGDPLQDVANFLVDLRFRGFSRSFVRETGRLFLHHYQQVVEWDLCPNWIEWHAGIQIVNKVYRAYIQRKSSFQHDFHILREFLEHGLLQSFRPHTMRPTRKGVL